MSREIAELVRQEVQKLHSYEEPSLPMDVIRLHANENPYPFPDLVRQALAKEIMELEISRYPDPAAKLLRSRLSTYAGWPEELILVGNGSNELILTLMLTFAGSGARVVIPTPTFSMYQIIASLTGAQPIVVPLEQDYQINMSRVLAEASNPDTRLVMLCSPNNPTGGVYSRAEIEEICQQSQGLVILDEAYFEFANTTAVEYLAEIPNLVVLRTFSKAFGLAGQRVGYLLANAAVVNQIKKASLPYNLNSFSQAAARVAIDYAQEFQAQIQEIITQRAVVTQALQDLPGLKVFPSQANFILFKSVEKSAGEVFKQLVKAGVIIRYFKEAPGLEQSLRVTIGTKEENQVFMEKLAKILNS